MTSPTAYPDDNDRYDGAIEELATELVEKFPDDMALVREMLIDAVESGDEGMIDSLASMIQISIKRGLVGGAMTREELSAHSHVNRAAATVATRRIDARLKVDDSFRQLIDTGKWPREEP